MGEAAPFRHWQRQIESAQAYRHATLRFVTASETIAALTAALAAEGEARQQAEALVDYYKLQIAGCGASSNPLGRGRKLLDQLELQLEEAAAIVAEDEIIAAPVGSWGGAPLVARSASSGTESIAIVQISNRRDGCSMLRLHNR
jgi:hypothetical protein